jgi:hypothetical protein
LERAAGGSQVRVSRRRDEPRRCAEDAIRAKRSTLGHVDLVSRWGIRQSQVVASLHKFLGRQDGGPVICYDERDLKTAEKLKTATQFRAFEV